MPAPTTTTPYPLNSAYFRTVRQQQLRWWVPDPGEGRVLLGRDARGRPGRGEPITTKLDMRVPMVADLASASADLLFGEPAEVLTADVTTTERLAELFATLEATLLEAAEYAAAMSGVWLRVAWDRDVADHPLVQVVSPAQVDATWRWGQVVEATIYQPVEGKNARSRWVHAEHHRPGSITHSLHSSPEGASTLGPPFPLSYSPVTADLMPSTELPDGIMALVYLKNMGPSRHGDWGRADTEGLGHFLDALDTAWTSWVRDVRLGKARIVVPNDMLRRSGRGQGATFDEDQEVYAAFEADPKNIPKPELIQPDIRTKAHADTVTNLLERIITSAGFSPESFGFRQSGVAETASALRIREHRTLRTRARKQRYARDALASLARVLLAVDRQEFGGRGNPRAAMRVKFGDTAAAGPLELAQTAQMMDAARAASTLTKVRTLHPEWEDGEVSAEVALIRTEEKETPRGRRAADPSTDPPVPTPTPNPGPPSPSPNGS